MIRRLLSIFSISFLLVLGQLEDETEICETYLTSEQIRYELSTGFPSPVSPQNLNERLVISINAHIVRTNRGRGGISETEVLNAVNQLNRNFIDSRISFEVCKFNYIDKSRFFKFNRADEALLTSSNADSTINIYFVDKILGMDEGNVCGYTYYPTKGLDHLILSNSCIGNGTTLSHEMGHFFGLYHTHEDKFGIELVNGSNCISAGDLICDTPADPGLQFSSVNEDCEYIGLVLDPTKLRYDPPVNNLMSYSRKRCRRSFTFEQSEKMRINYHIFKSHLKQLDFDFTTPDPLVVRGQSLALQAEGGINYLWNTGDTTNIIHVQPDSSQLFSVYIFTASGCSIYKQFYAEVISDDILDGPSWVCTGTAAEITVRNTKPTLKYQLVKNDELIGEAVSGNDSTLVLSTDTLTQNSRYYLAIINEEEEKYLESPQEISIRTINIPSTDFSLFVPEDTVCQGSAGIVQIPNSTPGVTYQLIHEGRPLYKPLAGTGDTLTLVTEVIDAEASFDIMLYNQCSRVFRRNAFTLYSKPDPSEDLEIYAENYNLNEGEETKIYIVDSDTSLNYQVYHRNKALSKKISGTGNTLTFNTGKITESTDFCVFVTDKHGCGSFMSKPLRVKIKEEDKLNIVFNVLPEPSLSYSLQNSVRVRLIIRDLMGKETFLIKDQIEKAGDYTVHLDDLNLYPKVYILTFSLNGRQTFHELIRIPDSEKSFPKREIEEITRFSRKNSEG
ncbi:hypothetical protein BH23BAC1_BH23BAC1_33330 [soil metagenome]